MHYMIAHITQLTTLRYVNCGDTNIRYVDSLQTDSRTDEVSPPTERTTPPNRLVLVFYWKFTLEDEAVKRLCFSLN